MFVCAGITVQREKIVLIYAHGVICILGGRGAGSISPQQKLLLALYGRQMCLAAVI